MPTVDEIAHTSTRPVNGSIHGVVAMVPCRGNSKGIVGKNLRVLAGKPMLLWRLEALAECERVDRIVVSTESPDIASFCRLRGYEVLERPPELSADDTTVGEVAAHAVKRLDWRGTVVLAQPTSPFVSAKTVDQALDVFDRGECDALIAVANEAHIMWRRDEQLVPSWNRQDLAENGYATECGALFIADAPLVVERKGFRGDRARLFRVPHDETLDIDTHADLAAARLQADSQHIHFHVESAQGTGHLHRVLSLAEHLDHHQLSFSFTDPDVMPYWCARYEDFGEVFGPGIVRDAQEADLLVHDSLDSNPRTIHETKAAGTRVVTLEDLGPGSDHADLVVNELYRDDRAHVLSGPRYAVLRPEFLCLPDFDVRDEPRRVLLLFGGTDPDGLTKRVHDVLTGSLPVDVDVTTVGAEESVSEAMMRSDVLVSSAGRTANEACAVGIPTIAIAANHRESRHYHSDGVIWSGLSATVSDSWIGWSVNGLLKRPELRREISDRMRGEVDGRGAQRVTHRIEGLLKGLE